MEKVAVTLEMCTLFKGLPSGLALIQFTHPSNKALSFKGVGLFNEGILNNTSFTCITGNGYGRFFSKMHNGRPAHKSYYTDFNAKGYKQHVNSLNEKTDVSG